MATNALFPALPLPSIVKLNTGLKLAVSFDLTQTETNKSALNRVESAGWKISVHLTYQLYGSRVHTVPFDQKMARSPCPTALTLGLQKVSAQLEVSKPAPQTVLNSQ